MLQAFEHGYKYICFVLVPNVRYAFGFVFVFVCFFFFFFFFSFLHLYCSAPLFMPHHPISSNMWTEGLSTADQLQKKKCMSNMEKRFRNKIIIITIIIINCPFVPRGTRHVARDERPTCCT